LEKKTFPFKGREVPGEEIPFEAKAETWNQYELADGSRLKVKYVMLDVIRLEEYSDNGDPIYMIRGQQIIGVEVPENLKRKQQ